MDSYGSFDAMAVGTGQSTSGGNTSEMSVFNLNLKWESVENTLAKTLWELRRTASSLENIADDEDKSDPRHAPTQKHVLEAAEAVQKAFESIKQKPFEGNTSLFYLCLLEISFTFHL